MDDLNDELKTGDPTIDVVQLEGLVLLRIMKHCRDNSPNAVTGQLLGLDVGSKLEVTCCFPFKRGSDPDKADESNSGVEEHTHQMMLQLRQVNVDSNVVGWYRSAFLGSFVQRQVVEYQFTFQSMFPNSVFVVFDPYRTNSGRLALQAYRLTSDFMALFKKRKFSQSDFTNENISSCDIFEEIPIKVHNSYLVHAFLYELREQKSMSCDFDRLELSTAPELSENIELLSQSIKSFAVEQREFQQYQRQLSRQLTDQQAFLSKIKHENLQRKMAGKPEKSEEEVTKNNPLFKPLPDVERLNILLQCHQMNQYCDQMLSAATMGFNKMFVTQGFHEDEEK